MKQVTLALALLLTVGGVAQAATTIAGTETTYSYNKEKGKKKKKDKKGSCCKKGEGKEKDSCEKKK